MNLVTELAVTRNVYKIETIKFGLCEFLFNESVNFV